MKTKILLIIFLLGLVSFSIAGTLGGRLPDYGGDGGFVSPATENLDMDGYLIDNVLTLDTGQGANNLYDMDQNVLTVSTPTFASIIITNSVTAGSVTVTGNLQAARE